MFGAPELEALWLSFKVSATGVGAALPIAVLLGFTLARARFPGKVLLDGLVTLPLILPPVVMGYLLLVTLGTRAPVGAWLLDNFGIRLVFSWTGAAVAAGIVTLPFAVRAVRQAVEAIDGGLEQAARTLGAGPVDIFFSILLPLALPGIIAGAITAFAASLGEFGAIITFVSNVPGETRTIPLAIYSAIQSPGGEAVAARLAILSIVLALCGLLLADLAGRRARRLVGR